MFLSKNLNLQVFLELAHILEFQINEQNIEKHDTKSFSSGSCDMVWTSSHAVILVT